MNVRVEIKLTWQEQPPSGEPCKACGEPIYSKMYVQHLNGKETDMKVCEACYYVISRPESDED